MRSLEESRNRFEQEWSRLRRSLRREIGTEPRWSTKWILVLLALAGGVLAGTSLGRQGALQGTKRRALPDRAK